MIRREQLAGLAVAGVGVAHFTSLGLSARQTRSLAAVGTIGYLAYLAGNVARNR